MKRFAITVGRWALLHKTSVAFIGMLVLIALLFFAPKILAALASFVLSIPLIVLILSMLCFVWFTYQDDLSNAGRLLRKWLRSVGSLLKEGFELIDILLKRDKFSSVMREIASGQCEFRF